MGVAVQLQDNSGQVIYALGSQKFIALDAVGYAAEGDVKLETPVDTGRLKKSITHVVDDNAVIIGTNVEYAKDVEFGHKQEVGRFVPVLGKRLKAPFVQGKHFLRDGISKNISKYNQIFKQYLTR